jgi:selenocysteine-specific elongation factor
MKPGTAAYVRLLLHDPALLLPGDRFIIRMFSPVVTIGGGVVLDTGERRYRRTDDIAARLSTLAGPDLAARIALLVREAPFGLGTAELVARTGLAEPEIAAAAGHAPLVSLAQPQPWYVDRAWFQATRDRLAKTVREFHQKNPLLPGIARQDLRGRELQEAPAFLLDALIADAKDIVAEGEIVRSELVFHHSAIEKLRAMLAERKGARFGVPGFKEWTGVSRKYAIPLLEYLDREKVTRREGDERVVL